MKLTATEVKNAVFKYGRGFPLPILFDDGEAIVEVSRPHAPDQLSDHTHVAMDIGHLFVDTDSENIHFGDVCLYLQGLPIGQIKQDSYHGHEPQNVLHLDSVTFKARMPDRDVLIDAEEQKKRIKAEILPELRKLLQVEVDAMLSQAEEVQLEWIKRRSPQLSKIKALDLMDAIPVLPGAYFSSCADHELKDDSYRYVPSFNGVIRKADVESGKVVLCMNWTASLGCGSSVYDSYEEWTAAMWAHLHDWLHLNLNHQKQLAATHWAVQAAEKRKLDEILVRVEYQTYAEDTFGGRFVDADIHLVESFTLLCGEQSRKVTDMALALGDDNWDCTLVIPRGCTASEVLSMASSYTGEHDDYNEDAYDEDCTLLDEIIANLHGKSPAESVISAMERGYWTTSDNLKQANIAVFMNRENTRNPIQAMDMTALLEAIQAVCESNGSADSLATLKSAKEQIDQLLAV